MLLEETDKPSVVMDLSHSLRKYKEALVIKGQHFQDANFSGKQKGSDVFD